MVGPVQPQAFAIHGRILVTLRDPMGNVIDVREPTNLVVNDGLDLIASAIGQSGLVGVGAQQIGIGSDSGPIASADTSISTELMSRVLANYGHTGDAPQWYESSTFGTDTTGQSVRQCGILTSATGGVLFAKGSFAVVNKGSADSLTIQWTFSVAHA